MAKMDEELKKEVVKLYLFANLMYGDATDRIAKNKKTSSFEEERLLDYIEKSINESIENYFKDFKIDEKLFENFDAMQREHLVNLSKNIDKVKENVIEDITEEIFTPLDRDENIAAKEKSLETAIEKIINSINNSIESINRQIGYCMVLYSYENKGYKQYRLKPGDTACEECKERGRHTYSIDNLKDAEFLPLVHPNCRCTVEIIDKKNKVVSTIDSKAIEEQLGKTEKTKGMNLLDYVSALLSAAALIPGIDSIVDLISIPVDLLRGDLLSAGFDLIGIVPFIGEVGDASKALRIADKASDVAKVADRITDASRTIELPKPTELKNSGWEDITSFEMKKNTTSRIYKKNDLTIRYDKGIKGAYGYKGKDHYHILNPKATGKHDYYLDAVGNPVPKNSKASHIIP